MIHKAQSRKQLYIYSVSELRNVVNGSAKNLCVLVSGIYIPVDLEGMLIGISSKSSIEVEIYSECFLLKKIN